jgi:hypothetical protein
VSTPWWRGASGQPERQGKPGSSTKVTRPALGFPDTDPVVFAVDR